MKISIVNGNAGDDTVIINGVASNFNLSPYIGSSIWAIHWDSEKSVGEVEYTGGIKPNEVITDFTEFDPVIAAYYESLEPVPLTQEETKVLAINQAKNVRNTGRYSPITIGINTFDADKEAQNNINYSIDGFNEITNHLGSTTIPWTLADNSIIDVTLDALMAVKTAITLRAIDLHIQYTVEKAAIVQ
jgi:hypothetical protein